MWRACLLTYEVPPSVSPEDAAKVRLRVGMVLRKWIQEQFNDFDSALIAKVRE